MLDHRPSETDQGKTNLLSKSKKSNIHKTEVEYLIKWQGFSHRRNTWHTATDLTGMKGFKKVEKYIKRVEMDKAERESPYITKEEIEQKDIQREMDRADLMEVRCRHYIQKEYILTFKPQIIIYSIRKSSAS